MAEAVIFGAGKIARGFIGQLLFNANIKTTFIDASEVLVRLLNERGVYTVNVLGAPEKNSRVTGFQALHLEDTEGIRAAMRNADVVFTAMGGKNLEAAAPKIADALNSCSHPVNLITCENWKKPAEILEKGVRAIYPDIQVGFAESVVMRSAIEPSAEQLAQDPLTVNVQNFWRLPLDGAALVAPLPAVPELEPMDDFKGFLERKFYTYNAANGTVSFVGSLLGLTHVSESARDARVAEVLERVYIETGTALARKYNITLEEQLDFASTSRAKLRDEVIVDTLERNARDPMRKLGPDDRLVGSARLAMEYGVEPWGLATSIAAAIWYESDNAADPSLETLRKMREEQGEAYVLEHVCKLQPGSELFNLVLKKVEELKGRGWIK